MQRRSTVASAAASSISDDVTVADARLRVAWAINRKTASVSVVMILIYEIDLIVLNSLDRGSLRTVLERVISADKPSVIKSICKCDEMNIFINFI